MRQRQFVDGALEEEGETGLEVGHGGSECVGIYGGSSNTLKAEFSCELGRSYWGSEEAVALYYFDRVGWWDWRPWRQNRC